MYFRQIKEEIPDFGSCNSRKPQHTQSAIHHKTSAGCLEAQYQALTPRLLRLENETSSSGNGRPLFRKTKRNLSIDMFHTHNSFSHQKQVTIIRFSFGLWGVFCEGNVKCYSTNSILDDTYLICISKMELVLLIFSSKWLNIDVAFLGICYLRWVQSFTMRSFMWTS